MRILIVTMHFPPQLGGISSYCHHISQYLQMKNYHVTVTWIKKSRLTVYLVNLFSILWKCLFHKTDHIIVSGWYPCGALGWVCSRLTGVPFSVISFGSELNLVNPMLLGRIKRWLRSVFKTPIFRDARYHVAISRYTAGILGTINNVNHESIFTIKPGVDTQFFSPGKPEVEVLKRFGIENRPFFLSVGRLVPNKGFDAVIKNLREILKLYPQITYCIAGDGPDRLRLETLVKQCGLGDAAIITGVLSRKELRSLYRACEFLILPSRPDNEKGTLEGFGLVILEANACGSTAIGSNFGGIPEAIKDGITGIIFDTASSDQLTLAMRRLLENKQLREKMANSAIVWAHEHDWSVAADKLASILGNEINVS